MAVTNAVYASVTLLQQGVIGVIGDISSSWTSLSAIMTSTLEIPQCSYTANAIAFSDKSQYSHFFRTIPTQVIIADVMLSFASNQGWKKLSIIYTDDPLGQQFYQKALVQAKAMNINIMHFQALSAASTIDNINTALTNITDSGARIIMVAATAAPQSQLLIQAHELGLLSKNYVWLMMGDTTKELKTSVDNYNKNHSSTINYATDYQGLFLFDNWLSLEGYPPFEEFLDRWAMLNPNTLAYSCMMVMAEGFGRKIIESKNQTDQLLRLVNGGLGEEMVPASFNVGYTGPEGRMIYDSNGDLTTG
ncbi:periplasmic binding protein-like I [Blakeslea trispora]|nr:periplasmic binding protein-like I [Blakeslea trispora]